MVNTSEHLRMERVSNWKHCEWDLWGLGGTADFKLKEDILELNAQVIREGKTQGSRSDIVNGEEAWTLLEG